MGGGGAVNLDLLPMIQYKPSSSAISSLPSTVNFPVSFHETVASLGQSCSVSSRCQCGSCTRTLESVVHGEDHDHKRIHGSSYDHAVLGPVPSKLEVETAMASLQNFMHEVSSPSQELYQLQQILDCYGVGTVLSHGYGRVRDAFNLLQTDPSIKRLVVSLASDKAVWDAVMNNEAVRKLQHSCCSAEDCGKESCKEEPDIATHALRWIMDVTKAKVLELIDKFTLLLNEVFQPVEKEKPRKEDKNAVDDKVSSSLLLSIVILLIVVVARFRGA